MKKYSDKKILIIEDVVLSGDSLEREKELVRKCGYKSENVRPAARFVSTVAIYSGNKSDCYWFKFDDSISYYYPWGRNIFDKGYDI